MRHVFSVKTFTWDDNINRVAFNEIGEVSFNYGEIYNLAITLNELDNDIDLFNCMIMDDEKLITGQKRLIIYNYKLLNELQSFNQFKAINECRKALKYIFCNWDKVTSRYAYNNVNPYHLIDELLKLLTEGKYIICRYNR